MPVPSIGPGPFETELRLLCGPAADEAGDWRAVRLLNGWGAEGIHSYAEVAQRTGRSVADLVELSGRCCRGEGSDEPMLDAVLAFASTHPWVDPDEFSFHLAQLGLAWTPFSLAGVCEAARLFGREPQWRLLVRQLATARGKGATDDRRSLPRPFESWFEVEVFLYLEDLGHRVRAQVPVGGAVADLVVADLARPLAIECDGGAWQRDDRAGRDRGCRDRLRRAGYAAMRVSYADWTDRTEATQAALRAALRRLGPWRSVG